MGEWQQSLYKLRLQDYFQRRLFSNKKLVIHICFLFFLFFVFFQKSIYRLDYFVTGLSLGGATAPIWGVVPCPKGRSAASGPRDAPASHIIPNTLLKCMDGLEHL